MRQKLLTSEEDEKPPSITTAAPHSTTGRDRRTSLRSGYAFSHQQGFGDLIIKGELFKQVEQLISTGSSPQKIVSPFRQLAEKRTTTVLTPKTLLSQRNNKIAPLEEAKNESKCMNHIEFGSERLAKISKGQNVCSTNSNYEDIDMTKSSQFLHKIIVNDDEVPIKRSNDKTYNRKILRKQQKRSASIILGSINRPTALTSHSSYTNVKRETFPQSFESATCHNSLNSESTLNSSNACVDIIGTKSTTYKTLNETKL
ncbi:hypothetical protein WUBG_11068 [Wuchereria bancrofti]|nr:hypothetical protein WUBG_11068 [Wuchereria bancrofti]